MDTGSLNSWPPNLRHLTFNWFLPISLQLHFVLDFLLYQNFSSSCILNQKRCQDSWYFFFEFTSSLHWRMLSSSTLLTSSSSLTNQVWEGMQYISVQCYIKLNENGIDAFHEILDWFSSLPHLIFSIQYCFKGVGRNPNSPQFSHLAVKTLRSGTKLFLSWWGPFIAPRFPLCK